MKKLFAVLLTLAMLLGLAACGSSGDSAKPTIVGTWKGSMNMGAVLEMALQMEIDEPISCSMIYTFKEDGTTSVSVDEDSLADMMEALTDVVIGMMGEMFGEEFDFEAMLEEEGMTEEEFREQIMASVNVEEMLGDMGAEMLTGPMMQMMGGFTVLRLMNLMGAANLHFTKEDLLQLNAALNRIKK